MLDQKAAAGVAPGRSSGGLRAMGYQPGIDGLRALCLLSILLLHADVGVAPGGFLGVSTFFTLSGFLITALLVSERSATDANDLPRFWMRRARRLLPAALVVITATVVSTIAFGDAAQLGRIRTDAIAALAYVANWRFVLAGDRYGARFGSESPLLHFWSLAIEEQFYVLYPLVLVGAFRLTRRWRHAVPAVLAGLLVASQATSLVLSRSGSVDRLYFGTDVRASELLVGALAGWLWTTHRRAVDDALGAPLRVAGPFALLAMAGLVATAHSSDLVWYRGGFLGFALLSCVAILSAMQAGSLVQRALSWRPLVWVGVTSYGGYLVHWPVFAWLRSQTSLDGGMRLVLGAGASIAVASASYILIERPFRAARALPRFAAMGAPALLVAISLTATSVVPRSYAQSHDIGIDDRAKALEAELAKPPANTTPAGLRKPRIALFGDSTALSTAIGLARGDDAPAARFVAAKGWTNLGCSILSPVAFITTGQHAVSPDNCVGFLGRWQSEARRSHPDIGVIEVGPWEMCDIKLPGDDRYRALGDPKIDAAVRTRLLASALGLLQVVPRVVLLTSAHIVPGTVNGREPSKRWPEGDPARADRFNEILHQVAASDPRIAVADLGGHLNAMPDLDSIRLDGVHLTLDASTRLSAWLGPAIVRAAAKAGPR